MAYLTVDVVLFVIFLALNLIIGLWAGLKVKTLREFAIGNKDFSTATLTATIVATWIGGGFILEIQNIYANGLGAILALLGDSLLCLLIIGQVLAIRMGEFLNNISVAEAMGDLYGGIARFITAVSGILLGACYTAIQFQVISRTLTILFNVEGPEVTIIAAGIVVIYSAFGGIRSVTITDVFQFITFSIFIPILALIIWRELVDPKVVVHLLNTNPIFSFRALMDSDIKFASSLSLIIYFTIPGLAPCVFQRIAMARDLQQVKDSNTYAAFIVFLIGALITWVATLLIAENPTVPPNDLLSYLIHRYSYPGLKGLIAVGIVATAMSTADSHLNASTVLIVHDMLKPLKVNWEDSRLIMRLFTVLLGAAALVVAIYAKTILSLLLWGSSFYMPIVTVPLLLAIFGFRSSPKAVLIGMVGGLIVVASWDNLVVNTSLEGLDRVIPGMLANLIFLTGSHYLLRQPGGWVRVKKIKTT